MDAIAVKSSEIYSLKIFQDEDVQSPREDNNLGTMVCFHNRYNLGDNHNYSNKDDFLFSLLEDALGDYGKVEDAYEEIENKLKETEYRSYGAYERAVDDEVLKMIKQKNIIMPLHFYDHSIHSISTDSFVGRAVHANWDSGQVGWVFASHEDVQNIYGNLSSESIKKAKSIIKSEVETYDSYLKGECYGYQLHKNGTEIDSCWGFIGDFDDAVNSMKDYLPKDALPLAENIRYGDIEPTTKHSMLSQLKDKVKDIQTSPDIPMGNKGSEKTL